jgi:hypothetical protein
MFFVKTQRTPTQTDTTILSVYSLSLVTIITGHLILTKNSKSERFVHFFARERQSDSPRKTLTMQAQRPTFYIDCRKIAIMYLIGTYIPSFCWRILRDVTFISS